jgi:hypothetical protein
VTVLFKDRESVLLMLATVLPLAILRKSEATASRSMLLIVLLVFFTVPAGLLLAFAFPIYYWWMRYLPLCVAFINSLETLHRSDHAAIRNLLMVGGITLVSVLGLPTRLLLANLDRDGRNYGKLESWVSDSIKATDVVCAEPQAFYPLQKLKARTYYPPYLLRITTAEAASINCLVVNPAWAPDLEKKLGGVWMATGQEYLHPMHFGITLLDRLIPNYFQAQTNAKYNLAIYRRVSPPDAILPTPSGLGVGSARRPRAGTRQSMAGGSRFVVGAGNHDPTSID